MSSPADLDKSNVVDIDLGSAEFKANAHTHMAAWARRPPFYVLGYGQPQVVVGRYADVHKVFSDTQTFASEMPRGFLLTFVVPSGIARVEAHRQLCGSIRPRRGAYL